MSPGPQEQPDAGQVLDIGTLDAIVATVEGTVAKKCETLTPAQATAEVGLNDYTGPGQVISVIKGFCVNVLYPDAREIPQDCPPGAGREAVAESVVDGIAFIIRKADGGLAINLQDGMQVYRAMADRCNPLPDTRMQVLGIELNPYTESGRPTEAHSEVTEKADVNQIVEQLARVHIWDGEAKLTIEGAELDGLRAGIQVLVTRELKLVQEVDFSNPNAPIVIYNREATTDKTIAEVGTISCTTSNHKQVNLDVASLFPLAGVLILAALSNGTRSKVMSLINGSKKAKKA